MALTELDPVWTERAPTMRILDPLGVESIEGALQDRLLRPVLSIAITQRLRYLSYWAWVTSHLDRHDQDERALYEKVLLTASIKHDCPGEGTETSGIMSGTDGLESKLADSAAEQIDISPESFTITSSDVARFDAYYKGILYRLLLFEDEWTLTPLGQQLAEVYDEAIDVDFTEVKQAVEDEQLPITLINRLEQGGCLCQLTDKERELLTKAYWYLITPTDHYNELAFDRDPDPEQLELRQYLDQTPDETDSSSVIEATLTGTDETVDADYSEDLELFFSSGRDAFVRSSLVLLLYTGDWVNRRPVPTPTFGALEDSREVWRLLIHAEYASHAIQALFITLQEAVKLQEPIGPSELLATVFGHETFDRAAAQAVAGVDLTERDSGDRSVLDGIRDAIYYNDAPKGPLNVELVESADPIEGTWDEITERLQQRDPDAEPFQLTGSSERAYRRLLEETLSEASSLDKCRRVAAYSAVQLARIAGRYDQYFNDEEQSPYVDWFRTAHEHPGPITCWELHESQPGTSPHDTNQHDDWPASRFASTAAAFARRWTLTHYFERLYEKIRDGNGKSPQLLQIDTDGLLTFDYESNGGRVYHGGSPNAPTLKFSRLGDILYELGLIEEDSLRRMTVTDEGRQLVETFRQGGSL